MLDGCCEYRGGRVCTVTTLHFFYLLFYVLYGADAHRICADSPGWKSSNPFSLWTTFPGPCSQVITTPIKLLMTHPGKQNILGLKSKTQVINYKIILALVYSNGNRSNFSCMCGCLQRCLFIRVFWATNGQKNSNFSITVVFVRFVLGVKVLLCSPGLPRT